jgi:glycosyltransferase involved in cell wall biosynthesis
MTRPSPATHDSRTAQNEVDCQQTDHGRRDRAPALMNELETNPTGQLTAERHVSVMFLMRDLCIGGAQRQVCALARGLAEAGQRVGISVFYRGGELETELSSVPVSIFGLEKPHRFDLFRTVRRFRNVLKNFRPDILYSYLPVPNLFALVVRFGRTRPLIVWGVRASAMQLDRYDWLTRFAYRLEVPLARLADLVIVNSHAGFRDAVARGIPAARLEIIDNGIDLIRFQPNKDLRARAREHWGVSDAAPVVGMVARIDPMKDHSTFFSGMALAIKTRPDLKAVCVAVGSSEEQHRLTAECADLGITENIRILGVQDNLSETYNGFDLLCSTSAFGEGFPNSVAEAMACGVPCVVTAVGDAPRVVGIAGTVIPTGNPSALAEAVVRYFANSTQQRSASSLQSRAQIEAYTPERLVARTREVFSRLWTHAR